MSAPRCTLCTGHIHLSLHPQKHWLPADSLWVCQAPCDWSCCNPREGDVALAWSSLTFTGFSREAPRGRQPQSQSGQCRPTEAWGLQRRQEGSVRHGEAATEIWEAPPGKPVSECSRRNEFPLWEGTDLASLPLSPSPGPSPRSLPPDSSINCPSCSPKRH